MEYHTHRISNPATDPPNHCPGNDFRKPLPVGCTDGCTDRPNALPIVAPLDPDLARVADAWGGLPDAIKAGILAMVNAASPGGR